MPAWFGLSLVLSLGLALAYQLGTRRFGKRIIFYWICTLAAFLGGEVLAESMGWSLARVGDLRLGIDLAAVLLLLSVLWFLGV